MNRSITVLPAITDPQTRDHFATLLPQAIGEVNQEHSVPPIRLSALGESATSDSLIPRIRELLTSERGSLVILISDELIKKGPAPALTPLAQACLLEFRKDPVATVAITAHPSRMADIDRVIAPQCDAPELQRVLDLVANRLDYLSTPDRNSELDPGAVQIRPVNRNATDLREYFALRHRVYTIMGYLEEEVEQCRSQFEINEADAHALHLGAFYRDGAQQKLVGTARVVTNTPVDENLRLLLTELLAKDAFLRERLSMPYLLGLPIFQSHSGMNLIMRDVFKRDEICGELSRVIVHKDYRGGGISRRLIETALRKAVAKGARRLFLECLEIHEKLYEAFGFRRISGAEGLVVDVGRTMISMEMTQKAIEQLQAPSEPGRPESEDTPMQCAAA